VSAEEIRAHYDRLADAYDRERNRSFFELGLRSYREAIQDFERRGILEVGCGTGAYLQALRRAGCDAYGVDISERMCQIARGRIAGLGLEAESIVKHADVSRETGFERKFGAIVIMDCWECFRDPGLVLRVLRRALEEDGRLVIFTPNPLFDWFLTSLELLRIKKLRPAFLYRQSSAGRVRLAAQDAGFEIAERRTLFFGLEQRFILCPTGT